MAESQTEPHFNIKIEREERQQQQQRCFNGGDDKVDVTVRWSRDLPDASRRYEREVPRPR